MANNGERVAWCFTNSVLLLVPPTQRCSIKFLLSDQLASAFELIFSNREVVAVKKNLSRWVVIQLSSWKICNQNYILPLKSLCWYFCACHVRNELVSQVNSFQIIWSANPPYLLNTGDCCTWGAKKSPSKWRKRKKNPSDSNQEKGIEHSKIQGFDTVLLWHAAVEHWRGKSAGLLAKRHLNPINIPKPTQPEGIAHSSEITSYNCLQL